MLFLEALTGVRQLRPDPANFGGGQHALLRNASLGVHADFNVRHVRGATLHRRVAVVLYLNARWDAAAWRGELELWPRELSACGVARVPPRRNTLVVFSADNGGSPITSLQIHKDDGLNGMLSPWLTVDQSVSTKVDTFVVPGRTYRYRTVATN